MGRQSKLSAQQRIQVNKIRFRDLIDVRTKTAEMILRKENAIKQLLNLYDGELGGTFKEIGHKYPIAVHAIAELCGLRNEYNFFSGIVRGFDQALTFTDERMGSPEVIEAAIREIMHLTACAYAPNLKTIELPNYDSSSYMF